MLLNKFLKKTHTHTYTHSLNCNFNYEWRNKVLHNTDSYCRFLLPNTFENSWEACSRSGWQVVKRNQTLRNASLVQLHLCVRSSYSDDRVNCAWRTLYFTLFLLLSLPLSLSLSPPPLSVPEGKHLTTTQLSNPDQNKKNTVTKFPKKMYVSIQHRYNLWAISAPSPHWLCHYRLYDRRIRILFLPQDRDFSLYHHVKTGSGAHKIFHPTYRKGALRRE
jgi:hypothetical protein